MGETIGIILALTAAGLLAVVLVVVGIKVFAGIAWLVKHVAKFVGNEIADIFRIVGAFLTSQIYALLVLGNVIIGRWSAATHFGTGLQGEVRTLALALYRVVLGHPAKLLFLSSLTEGIERRLPAMVRATPGADAPSRRTGQFDGYTIIGSLHGGGSGGKLFIAEPDDIKRAALNRQGFQGVGQVVIKSFSLTDGSTLPQILRENRALEAGRKLGLILEHQQSPDRFFYVMRYVPGPSLSIATKQLHGACGMGGLTGTPLRQALSHAADLVRTLEGYHRGGLWHKDVKPDNIIIHERDGRAHLVDFGLVTPLRSAMTLTTHGTEYFRDPEMVRLALKGVKVHEVDGTRFDIYGAGAVLYSLFEDGFPAHGVLSPITKPCPESVRWIVRRAMADYDKRYPTAAAMLEDIEAVLAAKDPFAVKPAHLPSMAHGGGVALPAMGEMGATLAGVMAAPVALGASVLGAMPPAFASPVPGVPPSGPAKVRITNWWSGKGAVEAGAMGAGFAPAAHRVGAPARPEPAPKATARVPVSERAPASEQLARARERIAARRERAKTRIAGRRQVTRAYKSGGGAGVAMALVAFAGLAAGGVFVGMRVREQRQAEEFFARQAASDAAAAARRAMSRVVVPESMADAVDRGTKDLSAVESIHYSALILNDALPPWSDAFANECTTAIEHMAKLGCRVRGGIPPALLDRWPSPDSEEDKELMASLRASLGAQPLDTPEAAAAIGAWLSDYSRVSVLIWITRDDADDRPVFHLFANERNKVLLPGAKWTLQNAKPGAK